jgi:CHAT domain-containing protein
MIILRFSRDHLDPNATKPSYQTQAGPDADPVYSVSVASSQEELLTGTSSPGVSVTIPAGLAASPIGTASAEMLWQLIPPAVQAQISNAAQAVQLMIASGDRTIDLLPWELLPGLGKAPSGLSVVRLVPFLLQPPPLSVVLPIRLLLVTSNTKDERSFSDRETMVLRSCLKPAVYNVEELTNATATSAAETIHQFDPHIVHYIGHGGMVGGEGAVLLRDASSGSSDWIRAGQISQALPVSTRLFCASTGFSQRNFDITGLVSFAHSPSTVRLPTCVLNRSDVDEAGVTSFWTGFYDRLVSSGGNVLQAFDDSLVGLRSPNSTTPPESFSLVLRDSGAQPLKIAQSEDPVRYAAEVQAQFAARLAADLNEKLRSFQGTELGGKLKESLSEERSRFHTLSSTAARYDTE